MTQVIRLQDSSDAGKSATYHQHTDLLNVGINAHRAGEYLVLAKRAERSCIGGVHQWIGGQEAEKKCHHDQVIGIEKPIEVDTKYGVDGSNVQSGRAARE